MRILDIDELPAAAVEERMRGRLARSIEKPRRRRRTAVIGMTTAAALIFGGGAVAWANGPAQTGKTDSPLAGQLEELGVEVKPAPEGILPEEEPMYTEEWRVKSARGSLLWPTLKKLSRMDGFVEGRFDDDDLTWSLYWHGELSAKAQKIIAAGEDDGLTIEIIYLKYTNQQLEKALIKLAGAVDRKGGIFLGSLSVSMDHKGISVSGPELDDPDVRARLTRIARETIGDIPVTMKAEEWSAPIPAVMVLNAPIS